MSPPPLRRRNEPKLPPPPSPSPSPSLLSLSLSLLSHSLVPTASPNGLLFPRSLPAQHAGPAGTELVRQRGGGGAGDPGADSAFRPAGLEFRPVGGTGVSAGGGTGVPAGRLRGQETQLGPEFRPSGPAGRTGVPGGSRAGGSGASVHCTAAGGGRRHGGPGEGGRGCGAVTTGTWWCGGGVSSKAGRGRDGHHVCVCVCARARVLRRGGGGGGMCRPDARGT